MTTLNDLLAITNPKKNTTALLAPLKRDVASIKYSEKLIG